MLTSTSNPRVKFATRVRDNLEPNHVFVEGDRLLEDLMGSLWEIETVFYCSDISPRGRTLLDRVTGSPVTPQEVAPQVMKALTATVTAPGIVAIARRPNQPELTALLKGCQGLFVALDAVQDPGNVGTIIRTAEAAGAAGVVLLEGSADPFAPKALRAAMGSTFRMPLVCGCTRDAFVASVKSANTVLIAAAGEGELIYSEADWKSRCCLVMGNEANGVSVAIKQASEHRVRIPLHGRAESLNAAAAAAVLLFEAARQRSLLS